MIRLALASILFSIGVCWFLGAAQPPARTHQVRLNGHTFTLPTGFEIEPVAGPPLVDRPIEADFDEQGRLYVSDSSGSNEKLEIQLQKKPHRIVRLEDSKGDGKFDRRTVFAGPEMLEHTLRALGVSLAPSAHAELLAGLEEDILSREVCAIAEAREKSLVPATFFVRVVALAIDLVAIGVYAAILFAITKLASVAWLVSILSFAALERVWSTPGKKLMRLRVVLQFCAILILVAAAMWRAHAH